MMLLMTKYYNMHEVHICLSPIHLPSHQVVMPLITNENITYALHNSLPPPQTPPSLFIESLILFFHRNTWINVHMGIAYNEPIAMDQVFTIPSYVAMMT